MKQALRGIVGSALIAAVLGGSAAAEQSVGAAVHPAEPTAERVMLGVYDPHRAFSDARGIDVEHIFVFWQALDLQEFQRSLAYAGLRGRQMMVTVEPYTRAPDWREGGEHLFSDIVGGEFAGEIRTICGELGNFPGGVLVRWGHEMEDPDGRYPWAREDAEGYKAAYRHFVEDCRRHAPRARFVWSPKGQGNLARYYPGDAHVDFVGVALWGLQAWDVALHGGSRDFRQTFAEKYGRVEAFGKPVVIAELGIAGDERYRHRWLADLFDALADGSAFERLRAVVYFNDKEPYHWPMGLGSPDWRVPVKLLSGEPAQLRTPAGHGQRVLVAGRMHDR